MKAVVCIACGAHLGRTHGLESIEAWRCMRCGTLTYPNPIRDEEVGKLRRHQRRVLAVSHG